MKFAQKGKDICPWRQLLNFIFPIIIFSTQIDISVQAEIFLLPAPTFLEAFDLNFHMPGHFDH